MDKRALYESIMKSIAIKVKKALNESELTLKHMKFIKISNAKAKQLFSDNNLNLWQTSLDNGKAWNYFNKEDACPYYIIEVYGEQIGIIAFDSYYNAFANNESSSGPLGPAIIDGQALGKYTMWIKLLEIYRNHSLDYLYTILEKLILIAKERGMKMMATGAKDNRVKRLYMRGGWQPIYNFSEDEQYELSEYIELMSLLLKYMIFS